MDEPEPFHVATRNLAEENAARWIRYRGYTDAQVTPSGPDGGIDVVGSEVIAQVKFKAARAGVEDVQRLAGATFSPPGTQAMFFTGTTYSAKAILFAEDAGIALFSHGLDSRVTAINDLAENIAAQPQIEAARMARDNDPTTHHTRRTFPSGFDGPKVKSQAEVWLVGLLNGSEVLRKAARCAAVVTGSADATDGIIRLVLRIACRKRQHPGHLPTRIL